jgi:hypothetical protein
LSDIPTTKTLLDILTTSEDVSDITFSIHTTSHKIQTKQTQTLSQTTFHPKSTMKLNLFFLSATALVNAATAIDTVNLGTAGNYTILTKTGISTVPTSTIIGNIAVSPIAASAITGFELALGGDGSFSTDSSEQVTGKAYAATYAVPMPATLTTAVSDMETAYTDASGRVNDDEKINLATGSVGGLTFTPGIYTFDVAIDMSDDITLDGGADDVFIIRTTKDVTQAANKKVILSGGAQAKNIFWQVAGEVIVAAGAHMEGILLVKTAATFKTGASLNGRILAQTACVLQMATIVEV